jgi:hypothetical protein
MGFLAPAILAGIVAVGLPVYLHLLRKQQQDPTPFATLMFLEKSEERHSRQKQLRYLLLFCLRTLIVLLLALIFAQPFYRQPAEAINGERLGVIALDSSLSMTRSGLPEAARMAALGVLDANRGKPMQVLSFARGATLLTEPTASADALRDAIQAWKPSYSAGSFAELAQAVSSIYANEKKPIDLYVVSDFQESAMPATFDESRLPPGTDLRELQVGTPADNWAIDSVIAPARVLPSGKVNIRASLASYASTDRSLPVSVYFGDRSVASKTVEVKAGERAIVEFENLEPGPQWTRAELRLELDDALPADNRFSFAIEKTDLQAVAFVSGASVNLSARYMETALAAVPNTLFRFQMLAPAQLTEQNIRNFAFLVVDAAPGVLSSVGADLTRHVRSGGSILLLLPRTATAGTELSIAETALRSASQGAERGDLRLDSVEPAHPVLAGLDGLRGIRFLSAWNLEEEGLHVIARLGDNTPVLAEKRLGDGRVLILTSTLDSASNDIPFHPVFVPLVERMARYLSGLTARELSRRVDDFLEIRTPGVTAAGAGYEVTSPDGTRIISRSESLNADGVILESPGFYKVECAGGKEDWVAVNVSSRESNLAVMDDAQRAVWKASGEAEAVSASAAGSTDRERRIPIGWYGFLILAGVLLAESVVANRYWRRSAEDVQ